MCGLLAAFNTTITKGEKKKEIEIKATPVNDFIIDQYEDQHSRGQKGFGIIRISEKGKVEVDRACEGTKFLLDLYMKESKMIIAHHRMPTSTENKMDQTHPIVVSNDLLQSDYLVVHNGIIGNDDELKKKHEELGFVYTTEYSYSYTQSSQYNYSKFNDSEALAIELALFIEKKISAIGTDNSAAFIILQLDKKTHIAQKVYFGKNGRADLKMSKTRGKLRLSSEGEGSDVKENLLYAFDIKDETMDLTSQKMLFIKKEAPKPVEEKKEEKTTTPLNLPISQKIGDDTYRFNNATGTLVKDKTTPRSLRSWENVDTEPDYEDVPIYSEKSYTSEIITDLKGDLKDASTTEITHLVDDKLDEEMEKIAEVVTSFKNILLTDRLEDKEEVFFCEQVYRLMTTMKAIADTADDEYKEKALLEAQAEAESYNGAWMPENREEVIEHGMHMGFRGKIGFEPKKDI